MNNLVVQLLLKTGTFSTDLKQAGGQVQQFKKNCQTAGQSVSGFSKALGINVGALTKLGGAVGIAVAAGKELKAIIDSNQSSADAFEGVIAGCTGVLETFNQAIATADFSAFRDGLWSVYDAAKATRDAIDYLNDARLAYGFLSSQNRTNFMEQTNIIRDPDVSPEAKAAALAAAQKFVDLEFDYAGDIAKKDMNAFVSMVVQEAGAANLKAMDVTGAQFRRAMNIKLGREGNSQQVQDEIDRQYKNYLSEIDQYRNSWWDRNVNGAPEYNNITEVERIKRNYADIIAVRAIIKGMDDDQLKAAIETNNEAEAAIQNARSMESTLNRLKKTVNKSVGGSGAGKTLKEEIPIQEESLEYWKKIQSEAQKHRDAEVYNSQSWHEYNNALNEALRKIEKINAETARAQTNAKYGTMLTPLGVPGLQGQVVNTKGDGGLADGTGVKRSANEINALIKKYTELRDNLKEGDTMIEFYNQQLLKLGQDLEKINKAGLPDVKVEKETVDSWETMNQALSNTSTIVSSVSSAFKDGAELTAASVLQMVATCLPAIGSLISALDALTVTEAVEAGTAAVGKAVSTSKHWIEAIAAVASLSAVVAAAIAAASRPKAQKFASGGIVGGTSFYGDRVTANVNSGEMILNRSQQARLSQMANSGGGGGQVEFHISGTELVGVLNNQNRKSRIIR